MLHKRKSSLDVGRKVSPPQPVFMSDDKKSDYLLSLRNHRPSRPIGARPLPTKTYSTPPPTKDFAPSAPEPTPVVWPRYPGPRTVLAVGDEHERCGSEVSLQQASGAGASTAVNPSSKSRPGMGRPLVTDQGDKHYSIRGRKVSPIAVPEPPTRSSSGRYQESGARWMERHEAMSIREALENIDHESEEKRIHAAARDEAADLVWQHLNPRAGEQDKILAYPNPDIGITGRRKSAAQLERESSSGGQDAAHIAKKSLDADTSPKDAHLPSFSQKAKNLDNIQQNGIRDASTPAIVVTDNSIGKANRRKSSGSRKASNGSNSNGFPNAKDRIYEDSEDTSSRSGAAGTSIPTVATPLKATNRNLLRGARPLPPRALSVDSMKGRTNDGHEIHKNPPSQSHGACYTKNALASSINVIAEVETPPSKNGIEIRGEDIRAATSMKRGERSPKLPTPTAVTDRPERPIASFDPGWQPETASKEEDVSGAARPGPRPIAAESTMGASAPIVPTINVHDSEEPAPPVIPTINLPDDTPSSAKADSADQKPPRVTKLKTSSRPLPRPSSTMPGKLPTMKNPSRLSELNPLAASKMSIATCTSCALPISGRIVTAAGAGASSRSLKARFHPECFTCHHCSTGLECVAFYPEPEDKRNQRLEAEDISDENLERELRFYCHLDFHELFSPRCKSCKTPIEGEVIVAAGAQWHAGHFFCSECGDPFDSNTPFVEKDNYAYCVSCHTRRTSARCRACKKPILDETTVQALGGQWHSDCFNCYECGGAFGDDGRFFVRGVTVEGTEKEKRRGIATRIEERAVCEACEKCRLKA